MNPSLRDLLDDPSPARRRERSAIVPREERHRAIFSAPAPGKPPLRYRLTTRPRDHGQKGTVP